MHAVRDLDTGELQLVASLDGYSADRFEELPLDASPEALAATLVSVSPAGIVVGDLAKLKAQRWAAVKVRRDAAERAGCMTPKGRADSDPDSQRKVAGAVQMAMIAQSAAAPFAIAWTMQDNSEVEHDAAEMIGLGLAIGGHVAACHALARALWAQIDAATDEAALAAIDIETGWPGVAEEGEGE